MTGALQRVGGRIITLVVVLALILVVSLYFITKKSGYTVDLVFPAATNVNTGGLVQEQGFNVGHVKHLSVKNGEAIVKISVSGANAPLHQGTSAKILYKSLLGERYVELTPGPKTNPVVPKNGIIGGADVEPRVELQTIVNQLDPQTREQLSALIPQFQQIFGGQTTQDTQATLQSATPTVTALAQVLEAVGNDGQTLHNLVSDMASLSTRLVNKQNSLVGTVSGLDQSMGAVATETNNLQAGINQLPATLQQANQTLGLVPSATQAAVPLLNDLQTATQGLPQFSSDLAPVLQDLVPVSQHLVPTLNGLSNLLQYTPALANTANNTVPQLTSIATKAEPAAAQIRPFTPDILGNLTDWGNFLDGYNASGHVGPVPPILGNTTLDLGEPGGLNLGALSSLNLGSLETDQGDRGPGNLPHGPTTASATQTDAAGNPIQ